MPDFVSFKARELTGRRPLKKGDVILTSTPFAYTISRSRRGQYCENCFANYRLKPLSPCKKCGFTFYCSAACVQESWDAVHSRECSKLKQYRCGKGELIPSFARLLARILFRLQDGGEKFEEKYCNNRGRKFKDLMNHYKDIKNDSVRMRDVRSMMRILNEFIGHENVPNESDFIGIYGRALVNRFCLSDEVNVPMGSAVFLAASIFDHSCMPNAHPSFIGKKLYIRTLVDLPELNLDKVFISYIDCVNSREMRRLDLHRNWYFMCECDLCNDQERALYENYITCENPMCEQMIRVPDRYSKPECTQPPKPMDDDNSTALQKALQAAKIQFKFASVPVNPFASQDACLSYMFYDKNRFQPASDSECSEVTDESEPNTPERARSPEPNLNGSEEEMLQPPNGNEENISLESGLQNSEESQKVHINGVSDEKQDSVQNESNDAVVIHKNKPRHEDALTNGELTCAANRDDAATNKATGAKPKTFKKKNKALLENKKSGNPDGRTDKLLNTNEGSVKSRSSDSELQLVISNDIGKDESSSHMTNGGTSTEDFHSATENKTPVVDGGSQPEAPRNKKIKKLRRKAPVFEKSDVLCEGCKCYVDRNTLREYRSTVSFTIQRLKDMKEDNPNFQVVTDVLERQGTILPKLNVWRVRALDFAFNATFCGGAWMLALKYGMDNLEGMKYYYGPEHPTLGLYFMKLGKVHMNLKEYRKGLQFVQEAHNILSVAMGPKHPFITEELHNLEMMANEDIEIYIERRLAKRCQQRTESACPCCGKKKGTSHYGGHVQEEDEKPWEKDRRIKQMMQEDSKYFSSNDFTKY
ncbi:uncharacterized protein LOC108672533 isoform X2 [Hyalella azteca]|uniref:Uncharacterized protein LOC108672533 isoform X2 n=1 Tax=Hyalella azteca TaxID=294128 RepID=A0A8B7NPU8_HYAAZ|nr:uncharacterized protein LOC108672533 isoform X2 [Hyalella azteca]